MLLIKTKIECRNVLIFEENNFLLIKCQHYWVEMCYTISEFNYIIHTLPLYSNFYIVCWGRVLKRLSQMHRFCFFITFILYLQKITNGQEL